jgi:hypothetical protein
MISFNAKPNKKSLAHVFSILFVGAFILARPALPAPKPVPRMQVIPQPYLQVSFQRDGSEIARYHFSPSLHRPFIFPVIGPLGRSLTRMGHPHDPESHSHHNSVWISHHDVSGTDFWSDSGKGKIRHNRIIKFEDGDQACSIITENQWLSDTNKVLLSETRRVTTMPLDGSEWLMIMDMEFKTDSAAVTLGKTPFGMIGIRMAKTIGVNDGGGTIRNSEGAVNEKEVFWKHVRNDGWMGASLTHDGPRTIEPGKPLHLRYGLYIHSDIKPKDTIEAKWKQFSKIERAKLEIISKNK